MKLTKNEECFVKVSAVGGCQKEVPPLARSHPDGKRVGVESEKVRRTREPKAGTLESSAAGLHRGVIPETFRDGTTR